MSLRKLSVALLGCSLLASGTCHAQQNTAQGAVIGGATGAVIGGLIGKQSRKTAGGAVIGGVVGAVAGGAIGRQQDNELARREYAYQQAMYNQQQQVYVQQQAAIQSGVSSADVVTMTRSGVNDAVIMSQLQTRGVQRRLEVSDIIALHQQGVSDVVISAMQSAPVAGQMARPTYSAPATVVYEQPPVYYRPAPVIVQQPPVYYGNTVVVERGYYPTHRHGYRF